MIRRVRSTVPTPSWLLAAGFYALTVALTVARFRQFGPDTRYYLGWAYRYSGLSEAEAGRRTYEFLGSFSWFAPFCHGACGPDASPSAYDQLFHGDTGGLVAPRVLYPLLSAPFVRLFGGHGMLVVPLIAYAAVVVLVMVLTSRLVGRSWAILAAAAVLLPVTVSRWSTYAYTEALAMAVFLACIAVLPLGRSARRRDLVLFAVFLLLFAFTRQFHPIVVAGVGLAWLGGVVFRRRVRNEWLPFLGIALGITLLTAWLQSLMAPAYSVVDSFLQHSGAGTLGNAPAAAVRVAVRLVRSEIWHAGGDYPLVVVLALAGLGLLWRLRQPFCQLTLGVLVGTLLMHVLNTEPSNFRYYSIVFPLLGIVATGVIAALVRPDRATGPAQTGTDQAAPAGRVPSDRADVGSATAIGQADPADDRTADADQPSAAGGGSAATGTGRRGSLAPTSP